MTTFFAVCWCLTALGALAWVAEKLYNLPLRRRLLQAQVAQLERENRKRREET